MLQQLLIGVRVVGVQARERGGNGSCNFGVDRAARIANPGVDSTDGAGLPLEGARLVEIGADVGEQGLRYARIVGLAL